MSDQRSPLRILDFPVRYASVWRWATRQDQPPAQRIIRCDYANFQLFIRIPADCSPHRLEMIRIRAVQLAMAATERSVEVARDDRVR